VKSAKSTSSKGKISYPHRVSKGSASVKIFRISNASRGDVFEVTWYRGGKRHRKAFRGEKEALKHADETVKALDVGRGVSLALGSSELESYHHAKLALGDLTSPPPLHVALQEFVAAKKILGDIPLVSAVERFMADAKAANLKPITVSDLVKEFIAAKESDGLSPRYIKDCRLRLGRFGRDFQTPIANVKTTDVDAWLRSLNQSPRSRNNFRTLIVTLFGFAQSAGYLPKDRVTEAEHVARAKGRGGVIEIFTCDEISRLLGAAGDEVLPYLALGAFAGIRTAELMRLTWDCIRFDRKSIEIRAGMAKTSQRRLIPLSDNLAAWIGRLAKPNGPVITLARPEKTASEVVAATCDPAIPWKRNGLRHSYASYRLSVIQDAGKLALEMGNSPTMIFQHYRELVTADDAKAWFEIMPKDKDEEDSKEGKKLNKKLATKVARDGQPPQT